MSISPLTGLDWQILELLQRNGRIKITELAAMLSRSRSTITEHIARLQERGVLGSFSAEVDEEKLGFGISAFVRLHAPSKHHRDIIKAITGIPEVAECHVLTGSDLLMIRVVARDMPHLRELVDGFTRFGSTVTDVIFSTLKNRVQIDQRLRKSAQGRGT